MKRPLLTMGLLCGAMLAAACSRLPEPALPTLAPTASAAVVVPTATPPPVHQDLVVCLAQEPSSLYLYGDTTREADTILESIYDGPTDVLGFKPQPVILEALPTFANGGARFETVSLRAGDVYVNPDNNLPQTLATGLSYLPSGCTQRSCVQTYNGGSVDMDRMVVDFTLKPDLAWSDGTALTSADSVYSYHLDGDRDTPSTKYLFDRTFSYLAKDDRTVEWTGIPGFMDGDYQSNFWTPLPKHAYEGMTADEIRSSDLATKTPIGWGPYQIDHWAAGEQIVLTPNPEYWAAVPDGRPFERVVFRFLGSQIDTAIDQIKTGECDILDETLLSPSDVPQLMSAQAAGDLAYASVPGPLVMRLDMNLDSLAGGAKAKLFSDVQTRLGLSACIDRQGIVDSVLNGIGEVADSYLPSQYPGYAPPAASQVFDLSAGRRILDDAGWKVTGAAAEPRRAQGVPGVPDGTSLSFDLLMPSGGLYDALGSKLTDDLSQCGVEVRVTTMSPSKLFAGWPDGPVFGRKFEAVVWSWPTLTAPPCDMFASWEVPSDDHPFGSNASGFQDSAYDVACDQVLLGVPDNPSYAQGVDQTQAILREQVPTIPLFVRPRLVAYSPWLCGMTLDPSSPSVLWNIEALSACAPSP